MGRLADRWATCGWAIPFLNRTGARASLEDSASYECEKGTAIP